MPFLPSLRGKTETKQTLLSMPMTGGGLVGSTRGVYGVTPYQHNWDVERAVRDGYERVIWVYRGINAIATNASRLPMLLRQGDPADGRTVRYDRLEHLLNRRANRYESARNFRYRLSSLMMLSKDGVFIEVHETRGGEPYSMQILPPGKVKPIPDPDTFISGYMLTHGDGKRERLYPYRKGEGKGVLWVRMPHPTDPYSGTTPLEAAGLSIDTDYYARMFNRTFLKNDGRPGGLIAVNGEVSDEDAAELKRRFSGGPDTAGRTSVIEADGLSWVDTATTPRDAQYIESRSMTKDDILIALGTPESVIGNASGRTFANADAEAENFWRETMLPHLDHIAAAFDELTEGGIEDDVFVTHDTSSISVLRRDERERHDKLLVEWESGVITLDEYREGTGRKKFDLPNTRSLWIGPKQNIGTDPMDSEGEYDDDIDIAELREVKHPGHPDQGIHAGGRGRRSGGAGAAGDVTKPKPMTGGSGKPKPAAGGGGGKKPKDDDVPPVDKRKGAALRESNFIHPETGKPLTRTQIGDMGEGIFMGGPGSKTVAKRLGEGKMTRIAGDGSSRNPPFDSRTQSYGIELKTFSASAKTTPKTTNKKDALQRKFDESRELNVSPAIVLQVLDQKSGRARLYMGVGTAKGVGGAKKDYLPTVSATDKWFVGEFDVNRALKASFGQASLGGQALKRVEEVFDMLENGIPLEEIKALVVQGNGNGDHA